MLNFKAKKTLVLFSVKLIVFSGLSLTFFSNKIIWTVVYV